MLACMVSEVRAVESKTAACCVLGCAVVTAVVVGAVCVRASRRYDALYDQGMLSPAFADQFASSWVRRVVGLGPLQVRVTGYQY